MSNDGGATWRNVPNLPSSSFVANWFVSAGGQVYVYSPSNATGSGSSSPGVQTTAIATAVPPVPPVATPRTAPGSSSVPSSNAALSALSALSSLTVAASGSAKPTATILRYDPTSNAWNGLTKPPVTGLLLAVTPANTNGGSILWLLGANNGKVALYRYVV